MEEVSGQNAFMQLTNDVNAGSTGSEIYRI